MKPLITKEQISTRTRLSLNIEGRDINEFIEDAGEFDAAPIISATMLAAIETNVIANIRQWDRNTTYAIGDKVFYNDAYYKCTAATTNNAPPNDDYWADFELMNFYLNYLVPFLAFATMYRFAAYHGAKFAPAGLIQMADSTYNNLSDTQRGAILGDLRSKRDNYKLLLNKDLSDTSYIYDGVAYPLTTCKSRRQGTILYALGGRKSGNYKGYNCDDNRNRYD